MTQRCSLKWTALGLFLLAHSHVGAQAQNGNGKGIVVLYAAEGYYEYARDGSATLGLITQRMEGDKVKFTMCDNKTVEVSLKDLRASKGKCDHKLRDSGPWFTTTNELAPVYSYAADATGTKVVFKGEVIDLKLLKGWENFGIVAPAKKASEPIGFVFSDSDGMKAMAILQKRPADSPLIQR